MVLSYGPHPSPGMFCGSAEDITATGSALLLLQSPIFQRWHLGWHMGSGLPGPVLPALQDLPWPLLGPSVPLSPALAQESGAPTHSTMLLLGGAQE